MDVATGIEMAVIGETVIEMVAVTVTVIEVETATDAGTVTGIGTGTVIGTVTIAITFPTIGIAMRGMSVTMTDITIGSAMGGTTAGGPTTVRCPTGTFIRIGRALDTGGRGLPHIV